MLTIIFLIILSLLFFSKIIIQSIFLIHRLQQLGYQNMKFLKWLEGKQYRSILNWNLFELVISLLIINFFRFRPVNIQLYKYITSTIMIIVFVWKVIHPFLAGWIGPRAVVKKKLVYTARVKRLFISLSIVTILSLLFVFLFTATPFNEFTLSTPAFFRFNVFILLLSVITPILVIAANIINIPVERLIHFYYFKKAKSKLKKTNIINIGITGSFGKTSTKFFISTILSQHFKTLVTPHSFNTPMGISKVINEESSLSDYDYFVAEMGADHNHDIAVLCRLVKLQYGILTAIGSQHLETFGSLENIIQTKFEILTHLDSQGVGIFNYDNPIIRENLNNFQISAPLYSYSVDPENADKVHIYAKDIHHTRDGLQFAAVYQGETLTIKTALLGYHNAQNLLAAILLGKII
ncbi:MAG: hypothetical protein MJB14_17430, partial [Spirochaetes bacterium]|nr:hypothetical protein [Spirochaetota bacterium]